MERKEIVISLEVSPRRPTHRRRTSPVRTTSPVQELPMPSPLMRARERYLLAQAKAREKLDEYRDADHQSDESDDESESELRESCYLEIHMDDDEDPLEVDAAYAASVDCSAQLPACGGWQRSALDDDVYSASLQQPDHIHLQSPPR